MEWSGTPDQAIARADTDGNPATVADAVWAPLRATPNHPEYPSAHACHTTAVATGLATFFGTDNVPLSLDSRIPSPVQRSRRGTTVLALSRAPNATRRFSALARGGHDLANTLQTNPAFSHVPDGT